MENWPEITSWQREPQTAENAFAEFELTEGKGWKLFDITALIRQQLKTGRKNYGIEIKHIYWKESVLIELKV